MASVQAVDPRTGEPGATYPAAVAGEVDGAVRAAVAAARSPELAEDARRVALLRGIAAGLRERGDEVVACTMAETGLPEARLRGELGRTAGQLEAFAAYVETGEHHGALLDLADPDATPIPRPDVRRAALALGPVAVFGASNFPLAFSTAGGDTAAALAAGCPVLVKGHPSHPGTGTLVAEVVAAAVAGAGLPEGTFAHLLAAELDVAQALVDHPGVEAVAFTGSFAGGTALMARAAARERPIPVFAEMGSLNPVVVTSGAIEARLDAIADALAGAVGTFGGQLCTKPGIVFVPDDEDGEALTAALAERLGAREPEVLLNAAVAESFARGLAALDTAGVERLTDPEGGPGRISGSPAVFRAAAADVAATPALREEHFGPATVVLRYGGDDQLLAALEALGGQLSVTVHAQSDEVENLSPLVAAAARHAGRVVFDGVPTGVAVTRAMHHGGPWPASSAPATTSVGLTAIERFLRPVAFQDAPDALLPPALRDANPLGIERVVDGERTRATISRRAPRGG